MNKSRGFISAPERECLSVCAGGANSRPARGFTLIEIAVSLAIVVVLSAAVLALLNPGRQLAKGRNAQRWANVSFILDAVGQNIADNRGIFSCASGAIPTSSARMASATGSYNIAPCLAPVYLDRLPFDPATTSAHYSNIADYDTAYAISQSSTTGRISVSAPAAELGQSISVTR